MWYEFFKQNLFRFGILLLALLLITNNINAKNNTLNIATMGEPGSIDPHFANGNWERIIVSDIFAGLFAHSAKGEVLPELATKWNVSADGQTYTFYLRDAKWSDGKEITAEDFVYSYQRILNPKEGASYAQLLYILKGAEAVNKGKAPLNSLKVKAVSPKVLEVQLEYPATYFIELLTHYVFYPVPKHAVEKHGKNWTKPENIVNSGAYKLVDWQLNSYLKAVRNTNYYDNKNTSIDTVMYYTQADSAAVQKRFRAKEVDIAGFSSDQYEWLKKNLPEETRVYPYMGVYYLAINTKGNTNKALTDVKVRTALAMAIDREFITTRIVKAGDVPAYAFVPKGLEGYTPTEVSWKKLSKEERLKKAKELLNEAGYNEKNPLKVEISYNTSASHKRVIVAIVDMWKTIGVEATTQNAEVAVHYKNMQTQNFQIGSAGWIADYAEASSFLYLGEEGVGNNYGHYSNPKFNAIMKKARLTTNNKEKMKLYNEAEKIMLEDAPYIPMLYYVTKKLVAKRVKGYEDNVIDGHLTKYMSLTE